MHYAQENDNDNSSDMKLPFKHIHTSIGFVSQLPRACRFDFKQKLYACGKSADSQEYSLFIPTSLSVEIWQPPKLV
jgi:hypothetical protein